MKLFLFLVLLLPLESQATWQIHRGNTALKASRLVKAHDPISTIGQIRAGKNILPFLPAAGEFILREEQSIGSAKIAGSWMQTVMNANGKIAYAAGSYLDKLPALQLEVATVEAGRESILQKASTYTQNAARVFAPQLEIRERGKEWELYWRIEYLSAKEDQLRYIFLAPNGNLLEHGSIAWDGLEGKAMVFPKGPKRSDLREETLNDLVGDGLLTGAMLRIRSALQLEVWSQELSFIFPQDDRRFDLPQAYFTMSQALSWLKEKLELTLPQSIDVRLHVGDNGVSNAAFYHQRVVYLGTGDGITYKDMIRDPSILSHELMHAIIDAYVGLPSEGEGGSFNEGFADLFTALMLDSPYMGEVAYLKGPYRRSLEHNLKAFKDFNSGVYQNGSIVAATFWDLKPILGTDLTAKLAFRTLVRLGKGGKFEDFLSAFTQAAESLLTLEQQTQVLQSVKNRGWK